ncbi:DUF4468 domain-containing protein [Dysgonomonas capnocytophagoides]|uniref:DUF4468 domain-containing protein n=1 Tax=Dysgonomonas capnocytophagoides TaxID=45254 RepID=UPI0029201EB7|nr:DUF4468 domain-containing protein [Dysgonomonas capnocytophagoides]
MKKLFFLLMFAATAFAATSQTDSKYLSGAVPEVDGKVLFSRTITVNKPITDDRLFELMDKWVSNEYSVQDGSRQRILLSNKEDKSIAAQGDMTLVFKRSALSLDQSNMLYQLILQINGGKCEAVVRSIKYEYNDAGKKISTFPAEEMITDKYALNKKGDKLNNYYNKFRIYTVDSINALFNKIDVYLNGAKVVAGAVERDYQPTAPAASVPMSALAPAAVAAETYQETVAAPAVAETGSVSALPGFRQISADKIPGNIVKLLNNWTLITSGTAEKTNVMTASWGGLGVFWEKPVAFCFLNPSRYSVQTMDQGETYTISFYTEAYKDAMLYCGNNSGRNTDKITGSGLTPIKTPSGATAFAEAWMIFECKKIIAQQISPDAVKTQVPAEWSKNGYHKMYVGEILNVWVK